MSIHASVLLDETVDALVPVDGGCYLDATCGLGGHTEHLLERCGPTGRVLSVDRDPQAIQHARTRLERFGERVRIVQGDFSSLAEHAAELAPVDGVLADLGVSSLQLDRAERGFSFMRDGPLDMRMGPGVGETAAELLQRIDLDELTDILRDYGEERQARRIARAIMSARDEGKLTSTGALANTIAAAVGGRKSSPIHPATRAFQGLRIAVNRELQELERLIDTLAGLVRPGGRVAIISFHSLEDRIVKRAFADPKPKPYPPGIPIEPVREYGPWKALTKKPVLPTEEERASNPRARSAKLRIAERREATA